MVADSNSGSTGNVRLLESWWNCSICILGADAPSDVQAVTVCEVGTVCFSQHLFTKSSGALLTDLTCA